MRTIILALLLLFDFAGYTQCSNPYKPSYYIPSSGCSTTNLNYFDLSNQNIYVSTNGSVNLGSNTYTLTYGSLPDATATWNVIFDASNLTLSTPSNVNLFGEQPLSKYPNTTVFFINFSVVWSASGVSTKTVSYFPSLNALYQFNQTVTFNGSAYFNDSLVAKRIRLSPQSPIAVGAAAVAGDTAGNITFGCNPWCITGNAGLIMSNYLGSSDTAGVNFGWDGLQSGRLDGNLGNVFLGLSAGHKNTSGTSNTAIGALSLPANTTGTNNASFGTGTMLANTTGSYNTALGQDALPANTTGSYNTAVGQGSLITNTTGSYNSTLGYNVNPNSATVHNGIGIGANAVYSTNQCAIAGVENLYLNGMNNHLGYALIDTSGNGNYVPQPVPSTTPLIDSVTGTSSQTFTLSNNQTNILTASTTVAGATLAFPAVQSGTIVVIWKVATTTTAASGTNTGTTIIPASVAAGTSRTFINLNGSWY